LANGCFGLRSRLEKPEPQQTGFPSPVPNPLDENPAGFVFCSMRRVALLSAGCRQALTDCLKNIAKRQESGYIACEFPILVA
jgi:hypothetical protein